MSIGRSKTYEDFTRAFFRYQRERLLVVSRATACFGSTQVWYRYMHNGTYSTTCLQSHRALVEPVHS